MKKYSIVCFVLFFVSTTVLAQVTDRFFQFTFGGGKKDILYNTIEANDKGFISVGYTESFGAGNFDMYLIKNDSLGNMEWSRTYGGIKEDYGRSIVKSSDGKGYMLLGYSNSFSGNNYFDIYLVKIDFKGDTLWSKNYGLDRSEYGYTIIPTKEGGYMLLGEVINNINGDKNADIMLIKVSESGQFEWSKIYGGNLTDYLYSIEQLADGTFLLGGETNSFGAGEWDFLAVKMKEDGTVTMAKTYGGLKTDYGRFAISGKDGGVLLGGNSFNYGAGDMDFVLMYTDKEGVIQWSQSYGETGTEYMLDIAKNGDDGYLISGYSNSFGAHGEDIYLLSIKNDGKFLWGKTIGGDLGDYGVSILPTADQGVVITGNTKSFGVKSDDCFIFKVENKLSRNLCNSQIIRPVINSYLKIKTSNADIYELETHMVDKFVKTIITKSVTAEQKLCLE